LQLHGVWFFETADLDKFSALLNRVSSGLPKGAFIGAATLQDQVCVG
jgi:hypothetical protein